MGLGDTLFSGVASAEQEDSPSTSFGLAPSEVVVEETEASTEVEDDGAAAVEQNQIVMRHRIIHLPMSPEE